MTQAAPAHRVSDPQAPPSEVAPAGPDEAAGSNGLVGFGSHAGAGVCVRLQPERGECPDLEIAFISEQGRGPVNEDCLGVMLGDVGQRSVRGSVIVLANGMSGGKGGRVAAELAVRSFIDA
jgi:hypothetical protein